MKKILMVVAVVGALVVQAGAWQFSALSVPEMAAKGATHVAVFDYTDFTVSSTNAIQAFTNSIPAKTAVQFVGLLTDRAYDVGTTNYTGSVALKVGDGSDDDLFLTSTELASDGTEVWVNYGPVGTVTVSATGAVTSVSALGRKLYSTSGNVVYTFTPNAEEALDDNTKGAVRLYFKLMEFGR